MKRLTKLFASIFFIITVVTIYLTFDFAITNALSNKRANDNIKSKMDPALSLLKMKNFNQTLKHNDINNDNNNNNMIHPERHLRSVKDKKQLVKTAQFHKSKTGVKINQIKKSPRVQRKKLSTTIIVQNKTINTTNKKQHS